MTSDVSSPPNFGSAGELLGHLAEELRAVEEAACRRAEAGDYAALLTADHAAFARTSLAQVRDVRVAVLAGASDAEPHGIEQWLRELRRGVADGSSDASSLDEALDHVAALHAR
jgi:hypothetical protein